jgi:hypothetical protein
MASDLSNHMPLSAAPLAAIITEGTPDAYLEALAKKYEKRAERPKVNKEYYEQAAARVRALKVNP